jgi:hypothetical protein
MAAARVYALSSASKRTRRSPVPAKRRLFVAKAERADNEKQLALEFEEKEKMRQLDELVQVSVRCASPVASSLVTCAASTIRQGRQTKVSCHESCSSDPAHAGYAKMPRDSKRVTNLGALLRVARE